MSKSYEPLYPKGKKRKPDWASYTDAEEVDGIHTDDTEFGPGILWAADAKTYNFAYKRRGLWHTVFIDRSRVKITLKARLFPH